MSEHAQCVAQFDVTGWDQTPYGDDSDGPQFGRATVNKTFTGGLEGTSVAELLMCQADPKDLSAGAGFVASERFEGSMGERSGSFVFQHGGLAGGGGEPKTFGQVVPGCGTGDFVGLTGAVEISADEDGHRLALDYTFS